MLKALYGMIMSLLFLHGHFRKNLESIGFKINPNDICVGNGIIRDSHQKVTCYVDDEKVSHRLSEVNEEFCQ